MEMYRSVYKTPGTHVLHWLFLEPACMDPNLDLTPIQKSRSSFGSVVDWLQNGPMETEGLSGLIFHLDLFRTCPVKT